MFSTQSYTPETVLPRSYPLQALVDEGRLFKYCNATPGTGIASSIQTSFAATNALLNIRNGEVTELLYPAYLRLICTVVPASATRSEGLITLDTGTARYSSGGSSLTAGNANMNSTAALTANTLTRFGALTLNAASASVRTVSRFQFRTAILVQYEELIITFGLEQPGAGVLGGTTAQRNVVDVGPCAIGPSQDFNLHIWNPGNAATAPQYEVEFGVIRV